MNECEKYSEMMSAMLDGELDHADSERLIAHMSSCARCRELYELLSAVTGSEVWELPEVPEGLHEHIMSGVKSAASAKKKEGIMRKIRPWAMAAACVVIIAGIVLGAPRFFRMGNSSAPAASALNTTASANGSSGPAADNAAPADADAPAEAPADNNAAVTGPQAAEPDIHYTGGGSANDGASSEGGTESASGSPEAAPVPMPDDEPEETEPPKLDIDIDRSEVTVESSGKSTTQKLGRDDTLIWLRAVIEGRAGGNIDAARIVISRREGADYEVYFYHDGSKLMGSLTEELEGGVELAKLSDFAQFEEMADSVK